MLDIVLAIALGAITLVTTHLTMHPAETVRARNLYKAGFVLCGIVALFLIGLQAHRNNTAQSNLKEQLGRIEKNTKEPSKVQIVNNPAPIQVVVVPGEAQPKAPHLTLGNEVDMQGILGTGSLDYKLDLGFTIINSGDASAKHLRIRGGGAPMTRLTEFTKGLDTTIGNDLAPGNLFTQTFTVTEHLHQEEVTDPTKALGGAIVMVLTYVGDGPKVLREEYYLSCCQGKKARYLSQDQVDLLRPLVSAAFP